MGTKDVRYLDEGLHSGTDKTHNILWSLLFYWGGSCGSPCSTITELGLSFDPIPKFSARFC